MRLVFTVICAFACLSGCTDRGKPTAPASNAAGSTHPEYVLVVPETSLSVTDTLRATVQVHNLSSLAETLVVGPSLFHWSLTTDSGRTVMYGPVIVPLYLRLMGLNPQQNESIMEYGINKHLADTSGAPIVPGAYLLRVDIGHGNVTMVTRNISLR